jgi:hypothetical protein
LAKEGYRFYRDNSWLTGPAIILPTDILIQVLNGWLAEPEEKRFGPDSWNDDNWTNEWVTRNGLESWHPLPAIVEHRWDVASTVGHGDKYSRERWSWRFERQYIETGALQWYSTLHTGYTVADLTSAAWWSSGLEAPLLKVGEE